MKKVIFNDDLILTILNESINTKIQGLNEAYEQCKNRTDTELYISASSLSRIEFALNQQLSELGLSLEESKEKVLSLINKLLSEFKLAKIPSYSEIDSKKVNESLVVASAKAIDAIILTTDNYLLEQYSELVYSPEIFVQTVQSENHKNIAFLDLKEVNHAYCSGFEEVYDTTIKSGWYILGRQLERFEKQFAEYCGVKHAIGVANGLDALKIILQGYKELGLIQNGDEVIVPANTFIATVLAVTETGLTPVFVEPKLNTYNLDPSKITEKITNKTKVVIMVHLYGQVSDIDEVTSIVKKNNLLLVEDAAQSHGALSGGIKAGALGNAAAFSFYPGKNLGALGDGGAITTNDERLARVCKAISNYGSEKKYINQYRGMNSRLDEIQAGFLSVKLKELDKDTSRRKEIAKQYLKEIKNPKVILPEVKDIDAHVWHLFVVRVVDRDMFLEHLANNNVSALIHYPIPPHKQQAYKEYHQLSFPVTEKVHREVVSLPIGPVLSEEEVRRVIDCVNSFKGECC